MTRVFAVWARAAMLVALLALATAAPAAAIKVATWNLLHYPEVTFPARQQNYRTVMASLDPDVLVCQEINSVAGRDSFLLGVLEVIQPGQWSGQWVSVQTGEGMAVFWKPTRVNCFNFATFDPPSGPRDVFFFGVRPVGYGNAAFFRVYSMHLKAGSLLADSTTRRLEATQIRANLLNAVPAGTHFIIGGDSNIQGDFEGAYARLVESQADNDGRCKDPISTPGDWSSSLYAAHHTQCPCQTGCPTPDFSGGGLDDRFDFWLTSYPMQDGEGFDLVPASYKAYGNDGQHYNQDINGDNRNFAVPIAVANALHDASDHIPVVMDIQVPAKVAAESQLDFGTLFVGTPVERTLHVSNAALAPADELTYQMSDPNAWYSVPAGTFTAQPGAPANAHTITILNQGAGTRATNLIIASDDPDSASKIVQVVGEVLIHAKPSWDSLVVSTERNLDLGSFLPGGWQDQDVRVYSAAYIPPYRGRFAIESATFTGGDGRFSIAAGIPVLANTGTNLTIHFDAAGATLDSSYNATLVVPTADEPIPGGGSLPTLTAQVVVTPRSGSTDVDPTPSARLSFLPPRPNPVARSTRFEFELPHAAGVTLEIFDLGGRRVASVASGEFGAGRHELTWGATDDRGTRLEGGLYFARFRTRGLDRTERVIVLP